MSGTRIALLSTTNLDLLPRQMEVELRRYGITSAFYASSYDQYVSDILQDCSGLYRFHPDHIILFLEGEDFLRELLDRPFRSAQESRIIVENSMEKLRQLLDRLQERLPHAYLLLNSLARPALNPLGTLEYNASCSLHSAFSEYNSGLRSLVRRRNRCVVLDYEAVVSWHGQKNWYDDRLWILGRMRLGLAAIDTLAARYAALIRLLNQGPRKCLVLDLDNTLWGGEAGTDGPEGIELGMEGPGLAYREFQEEVLRLHQRGILLAINSKNNWDDAMEVIERHPAMVLRREHFASLKINWKDKATNLVEIASELNIGLDATVYLDDSPIEREWVANRLPQVTILVPPEDPAQLRRNLLESDPFAGLTLTEEDLERGNRYRQRSQAEAMRKSAPDFETFCANLQMKGTVELLNAKNAGRVAQLCQKTNQFNLTVRRYTEEEIRRMALHPDYRVYALHLADRLGDNGLIGAAILVKERDAWRIDLFLLSCRVLGRTAETAFLGFLSEQTKEMGGRYLIGEYLPTPKNAVAKEFYAQHRFEKADGPGERWVLRLDREQIAIPSYIEMSFCRTKEDALASSPTG